MAVTVLSFLWGDWGDWGGRMASDYLIRLDMRLAAYWPNFDYRFVVATDQPRKVPPWIETIDLGDLPSWKGNLPKLKAFDPDWGLEGRVVVLDLDIMILGRLDALADYGGRFATIEDWYEGGAGGCINAFEAGTLGQMWDRLVRDTATVEARTRGSERHFFRQYGPAPDFWQRMHPGEFVSFKRDVRPAGAVPEGVRVVCFHGEPRPHEILWTLPS